MEDQLFRDKPVVILADILKQYGFESARPSAQYVDLNGLRCPLCQRVVQTKKDMSRHVMFQHGNTCHMCGKVYARRKGYRLFKHWLKHSSLRHPAEDSNYSDSSSSDQRLSVNTNHLSNVENKEMANSNERLSKVFNTAHVCLKCDGLFFLLQELREHKEIEHEINEHRLIEQSCNKYKVREPNAGEKNINNLNLTESSEQSVGEQKVSLANIIEQTVSKRGVREHKSIEDTVSQQNASDPIDHTFNEQRIGEHLPVEQHVSEHKVIEHMTGDQYCEQNLNDHSIYQPRSEEHSQLKVEEGQVVESSTSQYIYGDEIHSLNLSNDLPHDVEVVISPPPPTISMCTLALPSDWDDDVDEPVAISITDAADAVSVDRVRLSKSKRLKRSVEFIALSDEENEVLEDKDTKTVSSFPDLGLPTTLQSINKKPQVESGNVKYGKQPGVTGAIQAHADAPQSEVTTISKYNVADKIPKKQFTDVASKDMHKEISHPDTVKSVSQKGFCKPIMSNDPIPMKCRHFSDSKLAPTGISSLSNMSAQANPLLAAELSSHASARPASARPASARPASARPASARPVTANPTSAQPFSNPIKPTWSVSAYACTPKNRSSSFMFHTYIPPVYDSSKPTANISYLGSNFNGWSNVSSTTQVPIDTSMPIHRTTSHTQSAIQKLTSYSDNYHERASSYGKDVTNSVCTSNYSTMSAYNISAANEYSNESAYANKNANMHNMSKSENAQSDAVGADKLLASSGIETSRPRLIKVLNGTGATNVACGVCSCIISNNKYALRAHFMANHKYLLRRYLKEKHEKAISWPTPSTESMDSLSIQLSCPKCSFQTVDDLQLSEHFTEKHFSGFNNCDQCDYTSLFKEELDKHKASTHTVKICKHCHFTTTSDAVFVRHNDQYHT